MRLLLACAMLLGAACAQQPQNPSPMVEHTRAHPRLKEEAPAGRREKLDLGTLFLPAHSRAILLFFFHGGTWLPEVAASRTKVAVVSVQAGEGSAIYAHLFDDPRRFLRLLAEAEIKAGMKFDRVMLGGWSAGCGAVRQILKTPESYARVDAALLIDGMHTDYVDGKPGPLESELDPGNLAIWLQLARDAMAGRKRSDCDAFRNLSRHLCQHHRDRGLPAGAARPEAPRGAEVGPHGLATAQPGPCRQVPGTGLRRQLRARPRGPVALAPSVFEVATVGFCRPHVTINTCQVSGSVQRAAANPARSGRKQR